MATNRETADAEQRLTRQVCWLAGVLTSDIQICPGNISLDLCPKWDEAVVCSRGELDYPACWVMAAVQQTEVPPC